VTTEQVAHGERLESLLQDRGVNARFVSGSSSDREAIIEAFRGGDLDVMVATAGLVQEGFDVPSIESFVLAGGKKSKTSVIQQVGRALRPGESGEAVIVDCFDSGTGGYNSWVGDHAEKRMRNYISYYGSYGPDLR
jgi:superfamily II DNA or RNA helicase